jgi:hypothetical protein
MRCTRTLRADALALVASSLGNQETGGEAYETTFCIIPVYSLPAGTLSVVDVMSGQRLLSVPKGRNNV